MRASAPERTLVARHRLRSRDPARGLGRRRWLILVPHPDDETLGVGQLLRELAATGRPPQVVYLTDGDASHPGSRAWPPRRLAALRRREAQAALRDLVGPQPRPQFLNWPDAHPAPEGDGVFERAVQRLAGLMRRHGLSAIAATWEREPHCDHAAAAVLARAVARRVHPRPHLYWYLVWGWDRPEAAALRTHRAAALTPRADDRRARRRALARHRSQLGAVICDSPEAFRLAPCMADAIPGVQLLFGPAAA